VLTEALITVFRSPDLQLVVAGRTDAGVHARGQVAHLDVPVQAWNAHSDRIVRRLAGLLPPDVRVSAARAVTGDFDARFAALWRRYRYRICDSDGGPDPLRRHDTAGWRRSLDAEAMHEAAQQLLGLRDFAAYCRRREGASTVRTLQSIAVRRDAELIEITVQADAFCHSMVRSLVGALAAVGEHQRPVGWPAQLLDLPRRADDVTVAPARGLTLLEVRYPPERDMAQRSVQTRAFRGFAG
jgi:tRNA pseudouridine38-40 synthase